jgi:hypothetical protein
LGDVGRTFAQGGHAQREDVETIVQIGTKPALVLRFTSRFRVAVLTSRKRRVAKRSDTVKPIAGLCDEGLTYSHNGIYKVAHAARVDDLGSIQRRGRAAP